MSHKGKHCIAFQWKGQKIYLPSVVISSDLRRIADNVYSAGRGITTVKNDDPESEPEWNPSWDDDDEDDDVLKGGIHRSASADLKIESGIDASIRKGRKKGENVQESAIVAKQENKKSSSKIHRESSSNRKIYSKEKLFKNWMDQPNETNQETENSTCSQCGIKITSSCSKCDACATKSESVPRTHQRSTMRTSVASTEFKCEECGKVFKKRIQLNMHAKIHARMEKPVSKEYACAICRTSFGTTDELTRHQQKAHKLAMNDEDEEENALVCNKCNRVFERENQLKIHKKMCKVSKLSSVAPSPVSQVSISASETAFKNEDSSLICGKCNRVFERENQLKIHKKMCKVTKQSSSASSPVHQVSISSPVSISINQTSSLICGKCDRVFERENQLKFHTKMCKVVKQNSVDLSKDKLMNAQASKSASKEEDNAFICMKCDRIFERENQLKFHTKMCKAIKKDSVALSTSDEAIKPTKKNEESELACKKCDRIFERENQLKFHTKMCRAIKQNDVAPSTSDHDLKVKIKNEEDELICKKCDRVFERENQLKFHSKMCRAIKKNAVVPYTTIAQAPNPTIKTDENALTCKKCDRIFERENQLKFHAKLCKAVKDEVNELACKQCDRVFERPNQLNFHSKLCKGIKYSIGQPIKKEDCTEPTESDIKPFIESSYSLNEVGRNSDKKFTCSDCGRKFDYEYEWKWHQRDHMKACQNCGDKFHEAKFNEHSKSCFRPLIKTETLGTSSLALNKTAKFVQSVQCNTCGKSFANSNKLSQHNLLHKFGIETFEDLDENYLKQIMPFACETGECTSRFSHKYDLDAHVSKGLHQHEEILGYSNPTYYRIRSSEVPPLNPYVLLKTQEKVAADVLLTRFVTRAGINMRSPSKGNRRGRGFREDIPISSEYNCEVCDKKFKDRKYYIIHISMHKRMEKYNCAKCNRRFQTELLYKEHMDRHAADPNYISIPVKRFRVDIPIQDVYNCETCLKSFTQRNLYIIHLNQHKKERFACEKCDRKFEYESMYKNHVRLHDDPNYDPHRTGRGRRFRSDIPIQRVYKCDQCDKKFKKRQLFLIHTYAHKKEKFPCNLCDRKFISEETLEAHLKRHEDPSYDPNKRPGRPPRFRDDIPIQETYTCEICSKTFEDRTLFLSHLSAHKREEKYTCTEEGCGQKFQRAVLLEFHMKQHSNPDFVPRKRGPKSNIPIQDVYTCEKCDNRQFTDRQKFICHLNYHKFASTHKSKFGKRKLRRSDIPMQDVYSCEKCGNRQFTDRSKYILHLYLHRKGVTSTFSPVKQKGRQPRSDIPVQDIYYCEQCGYEKSFTDRTKYIHHIRNHNLERTHKCDGCLKVFKTVQTRDMHKEKFCKGIPCKYKCNQCSDRFHNKITLARHFQRYHTKSMKNLDTEIEFPCNQCSQTFNTTFGLTRHIQIYHPASSSIEMDVGNGGVENEYDGNADNDNISSHSWDAHDDEDTGLLAASFCQAELNETPSMPSLEKEEETSGNNMVKRKLSRGITLCQCGFNKKYKTQKFCHSLRCACVQNGNRCSKNCECDEGCLNSNEMEEEQQQKFREGKESMMESEENLDYQQSGIEVSNPSTPIVVGYNNENDDHYDEEPSTSSLSKLMPIPTSEFIAVDDAQDESIRQLTLEGYVEGAEDDCDPLGGSESPQAAEPEIEFETEQAPVSQNPQSLLKPAIIAQEARISISESQTPIIISTSGSTAAKTSSQPASAKVNTFDQTANLRCQFCKKNFSLVPTFMSHILLHNVEDSSLICPVCCKSITGQLSYYFEHINEHNNGIDLQCTKCSSKFKTYGDMEKHLKIHHFRPMECGVCDMKFQNSQLMMSHWSKSHPTCQCGLCNVKYFSYDDLTFHMKSLHSPYDCLRCNERFNKHDELLDHFIQKHSTRTSSNSQLANSASKTAQIIFKCVQCNDTFSNQDDFDEHLSNHLSQNSAHTNQHQSNNYLCSQCKATFTTSEDLQDHLAQHLTEINWSRRKLKTEEGFQEENIQQATEVFSCPKCSKTFQQRTAWRAHLSSHNLLYCSACDSVFETKVEIENHFKMTSCKVYICPICDRNFNIKRYLSAHIRLVHGKDKGPGITNQTQNLTHSDVANNMGFLTGRVTEIEGGNVQIVLGGIQSSVPVIVASTSLAQKQSRTAQAQDDDIEEILLDSD